MSTESLVNSFRKVLAKRHYRAGNFVEIEHFGRLYRCTQVDDITGDGSGLWISADCTASREFVSQDEGFSIQMGHPEDLIDVLPDCGDPLCPGWSHIEQPGHGDAT